MLRNASNCGIRAEQVKIMNATFTFRKLQVARNVAHEDGVNRSSLDRSRKINCSVSELEVTTIT